MQFAPRPTFGRRTQADTIPTPLLAKASAQRSVQLAEAAGILEAIPGNGEILFAIQSGRFDLMDMLAVLVGKIGPCPEMRLATLSYNRRNLDVMVGMMDGGAVAKMTLLCSAFFRDHNRDLWADTLEAFRTRGQRAAAARSHCKIVCLIANDGRRFTLSGSANLRTNSNAEQFCLVHGQAVHDWHAAFVDELVSRHEGEADE